MRHLMLLAALTVTACAGGATHERGWIGGTFVPVRAGGGFLEPDGPAVTSRGLVGLPADLEAETALLVVDVAPDAPLHRAGLRPGDLVIAFDDEPVEDSLDLRRRVESLAPGGRARLRYRRGGRNRVARVVVGREAYERRFGVGLGLFFSPTIDLWPFDDGINVLGLIVVGGCGERHEPLAGETAYFERTLGTGRPEEGDQETIVLRVIPLSFGVGTHVTERRAVRPGGG